jgi:hypothetical protein
VGGPVLTFANVNGINNAGPPTLPVVEDVCDHILPPMLVSIIDNPMPIVCSGPAPTITNGQIAPALCLHGHLFITSTMSLS